MNGFLGDPTYTQPAVGQGEAQILRPLKPFDWEGLVSGIQRNALIKQKAKEKEIQETESLLNDKTKSEWASDDMNYIAPKAQALKDKTINLYKEQNGKLTPEQKLAIKTEWNGLHNYVSLNNKLRENYADKVKRLDQDKGKDYDWESSVKMLQTWNNPKIVPEFKEDIEKNYRGDINRWRVNNEHLFQLVPAYNEDKYYSELTKDEKISAYQRKDDKGNIVYGKHPTGERFYYEGKSLTPAQVSTLANRVISGTGYKDKKTQEMATRNVDKMFSVNESGSVGYPSDMDEGQKEVAKQIIKNAGDLHGRSEQEIRNKLVKGYIATQIQTKTGERERLVDIGFAPSRGSSTSKETTTIANHYNNIAQRVQQNPNLSPEQVAQEFGGTAEVNPRSGAVTVKLPIPPNVKPFVAIPAANILIQNKGESGERTGNFAKNAAGKGQVAGTVAGNQIMWKKGGNTSTPNTAGAKAYGQITYNPVKVDTKDDEAVGLSYKSFKEANPSTNVTKEVYKQMLENGDDVGEVFKVEYDLSDPVQRTYYDQVLGGNTVSQTGFNREVKASGKQSAPAKANTTDPLGLF